ncbi:MAG: DUF4389 domain-containing protein [Pseudomonadota bacterium]
MNQDQIRANLLSATFWVRILFMLIFALVLWALWLAVIVICIVQTVIVLITGEVNEQLQKLGAVAAVYLGQIVSFMLFATEQKPFPFTPFPDADASAEEIIEPKTGTVMPADAETSKQDIAVLSESMPDDGEDDSFYDPERDSGATR